MIRYRTELILLAGFALALPACASTARSSEVAQHRSPQVTGDFLEQRAHAIRQKNELRGLIVGMVREGETTTASAGELAADRPYPIASASKWVAAALIMDLVDDGLLSLKTQVGDLLPEFPEEYRRITLRQLLSHASAIPPDHILQVRADSLQASALAVSTQPLLGEPGTRFDYGGSSFQVAAAMAEKAGGSDWETLFRDRLGAPLGISSASWGHPTIRDAKYPQVAGGLRISFNDYLRFLAMILERGRYGDEQVISASSIDLMEILMVDGVGVFNAPDVAPPGWRYGLGVWCEETDGSRCISINSAGAFGTVPWVDRRSNTAGLFYTLAPLPKVLDDAMLLRDEMTNGR